MKKKAAITSAGPDLPEGFIRQQAARFTLDLVLVYANQENKFDFHRNPPRVRQGCEHLAVPECMALAKLVKRVYFDNLHKDDSPNKVEVEVVGRDENGFMAFVAPGESMTLRAHGRFLKPVCVDVKVTKAGNKSRSTLAMAVQAAG